MFFWRRAGDLGAVLRAISDTTSAYFGARSPLTAGICLKVWSLP